MREVTQSSPQSPLTCISTLCLGHSGGPSSRKQMPSGKEKLFTHPKPMQWLSRDDKPLQLYA
jgi:hypothetical protein